MESDNNKNNVSDAHQYDLLPKEDFIVRPELNTAKFADFIFPPSHAKGLNKSRTKSFRGLLPNGKEGEMQLIVRPPEGSKSGTQNTNKVMLALYDIWHERHITDGTCTCSLRDIAERLQIKMNGRVAKMLERELLTLRETILRWNYSWIDEDNNRRKLEPMNILDKFSYEDVVTPNKTFHSRVVFRFNEDIRRNLAASKTKPFNLSELLKIKGEIAAVLYTRLDIILANRDKPYSRTSKNLFDDLQLSGDKDWYRYPSRRKSKLIPIVKAIHGRKLSTGRILLIKLEQTADKKDWKIVAATKGLKGAPVSQKRLLPVVNDSETIMYLGQELGKLLDDYDTHKNLYERFATHYSYDTIYQAMSEHKADGGLQAKSPRRFFTTVLHRLAHQKGKEWIKQCGSHCKYRQPTL
ncbi:MAG: hypothetical protein RPU39_09260 [Candidatus Sedimenticola sp. (ex Thyasira tokunagai)]